MRNVTEKLLLSCVFLLWLFAVASIPVIDEKCDSCGRRVDELGIAKPLRRLSIIQWCFDSTIDLHSNRVCPDYYSAKVTK